jgi:DNA-binding CsgD family transcriptional regulator
VAGEAGYRLGPLALPGPDDADAAGCEAVVLFAERARQADAHFAPTGEAIAAVARLVRRLDGMPLAIELAAARAEALGLGQLLDRIDDRLALLVAGDRLAAGRHRSLTATMEWSYQLLDESERQVFRTLSVFPGPFTLEGAEAVAGPGAGLVVLHLVDCSLLTPPRAGPDGRLRYAMLETLRAYGAGLLAAAGEQDGAAAALAGYALRVARQAAAGLVTSTGEVAAARWLDAEDATTRQVLTWALQHDAAMALRLAVALAPWWLLRGRLVSQRPLLREAAGHAAPGGNAWYAAQFWLGAAAWSSADLAGALRHFTSIRDAAGDQGVSRALADALIGRSVALASMGRIAEAVDDGRRALHLSRDCGYPAGEVQALVYLAVAAYFVGDLDQAVELAGQAEQVPADLPGQLARLRSIFVADVLMASGDLAEAERVCTAGLAQARDVGDTQNLARVLTLMAMLEIRSGRITGATAHLREALQISARTGTLLALENGLDCCVHLCAATGLWAEAVTVWAAHTALLRYEAPATAPARMRRRQELLREARQALGPARARSAEDRGAAMSLATAAEYALLLTDPGPPQPAAPDPGKLSARERELVTLVARGRTNAQIAAQLYISIRTVSSHLDRIRDKTDCRRRADLTRLALTMGLV